ncbi:MAG: hypothetical protein DMG35_08175 [Acidobacteria bacterium]|nr:MAG: hypothetical protein AUH86_09005 [Acidobacteria bacterium 13_1_40CM_4_58_4]PYT62159.1 MAG: hypothetical protein DMG35_08175 [Acidobacteriota bacterium]
MRVLTFPRHSFELLLILAQNGGKSNTIAQSGELRRQEEEMMIRGRTVFVFLLGCGLVALGSLSAQQKNTSRAGWISDEACAAKHTKPGAPGAGSAPGGFGPSTVEWLNLHTLKAPPGRALPPSRIFPSPSGLYPFVFFLLRAHSNDSVTCSK